MLSRRVVPFRRSVSLSTLSPVAKQVLDARSAADVLRVCDSHFDSLGMRELTVAVRHLSACCHNNPETAVGSLAARSPSLMRVFSRLESGLVRCLRGEDVDEWGVEGMVHGLSQLTEFVWREGRFSANALSFLRPERIEKRTERLRIAVSKIDVQRASWAPVKARPVTWGGALHRILAVSVAHGCGLAWSGGGMERGEVMLSGVDLSRAARALSVARVGDLGLWYGVLEGVVETREGGVGVVVDDQMAHGIRDCVHGLHRSVFGPQPLPLLSRRQLPIPSLPPSSIRLPLPSHPPLPNTSPLLRDAGVILDPATETNLGALHASLSLILPHLTPTSSSLSPQIATSLAAAAMRARDLLLITNPSSAHSTLISLLELVKASHGHSFGATVALAVAIREVLDGGVGCEAERGWLANGGLRECVDALEQSLLVASVWDESVGEGERGLEGARAVLIGSVSDAMRASQVEGIVGKGRGKRIRKVARETAKSLSHSPLPPTTKAMLALADPNLTPSILDSLATATQSGVNPGRSVRRAAFFSALSALHRADISSTSPDLLSLPTGAPRLPQHPDRQIQLAWGALRSAAQWFLSPRQWEGAAPLHSTQREAGDLATDLGWLPTQPSAQPKHHDPLIRGGLSSLGSTRKGDSGKDRARKARNKPTTPKSSSFHPETPDLPQNADAVAWAQVGATPDEMALTADIVATRVWSSSTQTLHVLGCLMSAVRPLEPWREAIPAVGVSPLSPNEEDLISSSPSSSSSSSSSDSDKMASTEGGSVRSTPLPSTRLELLEWPTIASLLAASASAAWPADALVLEISRRDSLPPPPIASQLLTSLASLHTLTTPPPPQLLQRLLPTATQSTPYHSISAILAAGAFGFWDEEEVDRLVKGLKDTHHSLPPNLILQLFASTSGIHISDQSFAPSCTSWAGMDDVVVEAKRRLGAFQRRRKATVADRYAADLLRSVLGPGSAHAGEIAPECGVLASALAPDAKVAVRVLGAFDGAAPHSLPPNTLAGKLLQDAIARGYASNPSTPLGTLIPSAALAHQLRLLEASNYTVICAPRSDLEQQLQSAPLGKVE